MPRGNPVASAYGVIEIWGSGPTDIYAVSDNNIVHIFGNDWTDEVIDGLTKTLTGVSGSGPEDVYLKAATCRLR